MSAEAAGHRPFRHYSWKQRAVSWVSRNLFDRLTYTARHGLTKGMKRRGGLGWLPEFLGPRATPEESFWRSLDLRGLTVYDIGAFHGLLTLMFARACRQVVSYEPNTRNYTRLIENLELNRLDNVIVRKVAAGASARVAMMVASPLAPGGASLEPGAVDSLLHSSGPVESEQVQMTTLDDDIRENSLPAPDFIKIDVEGEELAVLLGARETLRAHKPRLFIEIHGETMALKRANAAAVVACLEDLGYRDIRHVESGAVIGRANAEAAARGHLDCR